ncbi:G patch domain-containing protein 1 isoform X1 [Erpetoichthys calabaricus]|uniref:G patch domain-containing protein 1 isoform X1 n=1 Tax=Erpetoichthys calabaricus TaxID=27687 RepID=UPI002234B162|nr:G patch domain-containing protein 1 isoform X1 [Erpetoichthys calabaricus]
MAAPTDLDYVSFGTPLELLSEDEPLKRPVPLQEQTVKDERGRIQRFHGAFTGGFSAGYFNTVGSKEGWAPSQFISSRQQKAEKQVFQPEDFMDEEDLAEHGIAPREIMTTDDFASLTKDQIRSKAQALSVLAAPIPGATVLEDLIAASRISIGVKLLRKMGWKEGQGIGPRVKRKLQRQRNGAGLRLYGCALPPEDSDKSEEEDDAYIPENVTFAPKDVIPIDFTPKDNLHGLGYSGIDPGKAIIGGVLEEHIHLFSVESERTSNLLGSEGGYSTRKIGVSGQAFGVGVLEEEDDDIYGTESLSRYDTVIGEEEPGDSMYGWSAPYEYSKKNAEFIKDIAYAGRILEGFTKPAKSLSIKKIYLPPELPRDYKPVHCHPILPTSDTGYQKSSDLMTSCRQMEQAAVQNSRHQMNAVLRRNLIEEPTLPGPSSVFDLLSNEAKNRIKEVKQAAEQKQLSQSLPSCIQTVSNNEALRAWQNICGDEIGTFKPFEKIPEKQARYEKYISKLKQGRSDALETSLDSQMTEWERGREREEFVRAAMLYKPSNSTLASRFTQGKHEDDSENVYVVRDHEDDLNDKDEAVKMKMFGQLTRDTFEWHPDKLLCKRFNIPDPYPSSSIVGLTKVKKDKYSVFNFLNVMENAKPHLKQSQSELSTDQKPDKASTPLKSNRRSRWDVPGKENDKKDSLSEFITLARSQSLSERQGSQPDSSEPAIVPKEQTPPTLDDLEEKRPSMDLFKAIFANSSDDESSSEGDSNDEDNQQGQNKSSLIKDPTSLIECQEPCENKTKETFSNKEECQPTKSSDTSENLATEEQFGPRLPPVIPDGTVSLSSGSVFPETIKRKYKEKQNKHKPKMDHKQKRYKKKKKHKKHKHKSKSKKKIIEGCTSSSDSTENSGSDTGASSSVLSTEVLLKRIKSLPTKT